MFHSRRVLVYHIRILCSLGFIACLFCIAQWTVLAFEQASHKSNIHTRTSNSNTKSFRTNRKAHEARVTQSYSFKKLDAFYSSERMKRNYSCLKLMQNDSTEMLKARTEFLYSMETPRQDSTSCDVYRRTRGFILDSLTNEEKFFPIAYSVVIYSYTLQVEQLLRAIYRPQNLYCIHIDKKCKKCRAELHWLLECFSNVFTASESISVTWGKYSVLEAELVCLNDLWQRSNKWKYFINLTGQEFPLKTNYELVKILRAFDGANNIQGHILGAKRWRGRWDMSSAVPPPHDITPIKGSVHVILSRAAVDYILHNPISLEFQNWTKFTDIPDELFFGSLNFNQHLKFPGGLRSEYYKGLPKDPEFVARYKLWTFDKKSRELCHRIGSPAKSICIFNASSIPILTNKTNRKLFVNKLYIGYSDPGIHCLSEWIYNKTKNEYFKRTTFNPSYYKSLDFVINRRHNK